MKNLGQVSISLLGVIVAAAAAGTEFDSADGWFEDDVEERIANVNDGELKFLSLPPADPVHHHHNTLVLDESSFEHGWAQLSQCHEHLDAVPRAEVVFRKGHLRKLTITDKQNIGRAWVEGASVQLVDVRPEARLCLSAESRVLRHNEDGSYSVHNGPYMRRFLDGYYPMRVSVEVRYPCGRLKLADLSPPRQKGFSVMQTPCAVVLDAWFEGKLRTELRFVDLSPES